MTAQQEIAASIVSNMVAVILLLLSWKRKNIARISFSLLFIWAAVINWKTAQYSPTDYLDYSRYAIPLYKHIIQGAFAKQITGYVNCIAGGQLLIGLGLLSKDIIVKTACIGGIVFLIAIAPLGMGAAFPFSITASIGLWLLNRHRFTKTIFRNKWFV